MATSKKPAAKKPRSITISIDLSALDKLYKKRYVISLDGGDTKGGSVRVRDGDTKGGLRIRDGDTKGDITRPKRPGPVEKKARKR